jgi:hypothetical protein
MGAPRRATMAETLDGMSERLDLQIGRSWAWTNAPAQLKK